MNKRQDSIFFYCGLIVSGLIVQFWLIPYFIRRKENVPIGPEVFPRIVAGLIIFLAVVGALLEYRAMKAEGGDFSAYRVNLKKYLPQAIFLLSGFVFVSVAPVLGFPIASSLFLLFLLFYFGSQGTVRNVLLALFYPTALFLLFSRVLGISFPSGIFGF